MAALGLLNLQVKRFDISLDLFDPSNDLLFKYFLAVGYIIGGLIVVACRVSTLR